VHPHLGVERARRAHALWPPPRAPLPGSALSTQLATLQAPTPLQRSHF